MNTARTVSRHTSIVIALAFTATLAGCATTDPASPTTESPSPETSDARTFEGLVEVGDGRSLNAMCWGEGSPAVIYLHGLIMQNDAVSWAHAPELRQRLAPDTTYCEYERTNVGKSSTVEGPIPVSDSVADLAALIDGLGLETPVVLVGGSFGGLIAYTYAGTHPDDVAGVVLLDPTLPAEDEIEKELLPEDMWLPADAWQDSREQIDVLGAYPLARAALESVPSVPGTIFVTEELWAPDGDAAEHWTAGIRDMQDQLIAHFEPGETIVVDAPHTMLSVVPDPIAASVLAIVEGAR